MSKVLGLKKTYQLPFFFFELLYPLLESANIAITWSISMYLQWWKFKSCSPARRSDGAFVLNLRINTLIRTKTPSRTRIANRTSAVATNFTIATLSTSEGSRFSRSRRSLSARRSCGGRRSGRAAAGGRRLCPSHCLLSGGRITSNQSRCEVKLK
jgi:hypothetical protein